MRRGVLGLVLFAAVLLTGWIAIRSLESAPLPGIPRPEPRPVVGPPRPSPPREAPRPPAAPPAPAAPRVPEDDRPAPKDGSAPDDFSDPVQTGKCALVLRLLDADTGAPVTMNVELWRLNAPGNRRWTAGDQRQAAVAVQGAEARVENLPAGEYRLACPERRAAAEDPPSFRVEGAETEHAARVPMPRTFRARLKVYDEDGGSLRAGRRADRGRTTAGRPYFPPWQRLRGILTGKDETEISVIRVGGGAGAAFGGRRGGRAEPPAVEAGRDGLFDLGEFREASACETATATSAFTLEGRSGVDASFSNEGATSDVFLVAVSVPLDRLSDEVTLPGGEPVARFRPRVSGTCRAVRVPPGEPDPDRRRLPIQVSVHLDGYEDLSFDWTPAGPREARALVPAKDL